MSIWKGNIWAGTPWAGGVWKSQHGFGQYALYLDFPNKGMVDQVSKKAITTNISAGNRYDLVNGVQTVFTEDQPVITERGLRGVGAYTNLCLWSEDPSKIGSKNATTYINNIFTIPADGDNYFKLDPEFFQLPNLAIGATYSVGVDNLTGTGEVRITAARFGGTFESWNVAISLSSTPQTAIIPVVFEYGDHTGIYIRFDDNGSGCTVNDDFTTQLTESPYPLPYIPTQGAVAPSVDESGSADPENGVWLDDVSANFPDLFDALDGVEQSELIINGTFDTNTTGWVINRSSLLLSENGKLKITNFGNTYGGATQETATIVGNRDRFVLDAFLGNARPKLSIGSSAYLFDLVGSGDITTDSLQLTYEFTATTEITYIRMYVASPTIGDYCYLDNISLRQISPAQGTLTLNWTPGYSAADITGEQGLISFDGTTNSLRYDADNQLLELTDGTNVASVACTPVAGTTCQIKATWEGAEMRLWVDSTAGTMGVFTGTFSPGTDINLNVSNELNYVDEIKLLKEPDWDDTFYYVLNEYVESGYIL